MALYSRYCFTWNNYKPEHHAIITKMATNYNYIVYRKEVGPNVRDVLIGYAELRNGTSGRVINRNHLKYKADIERLKAPRDEAIAWCKTGDWAEFNGTFTGLNGVWQAAVENENASPAECMDVNDSSSAGEVLPCTCAKYIPKGNDHFVFMTVDACMKGEFAVGGPKEYSTATEYSHLTIQAFDALAALVPEAHLRHVSDKITAMTGYEFGKNWQLGPGSQEAIMELIVRIFRLAKYVFMSVGLGTNIAMAAFHICEALTADIKECM